MNPFYPDLAIKEKTIENIEMALYHNYIKMVGKIMLYSPSNMKTFLTFYLLKFEIINIKQIIIGSILGLRVKDKKKMVNFVVEEYLDNTEFIDDLLKISSLDEIQYFMKKTRYNIPISEGISYFKKYREIFVLEAFLDKFYYENMIIQLNNLRAQERKIIETFVKYKTEIYNLKIIFRGLKNGIEKELLSQFLIDYHLFLDMGKINYLLSIEDLNVLISLIEEYINSNRELKRGSEQKLVDREHLINSIEDLYLHYYFIKFKISMGEIDLITIFRILELIIKKENEIRFHIIPKIVKIIHEKFEKLQSIE
ncbi:MAG: V-type ATPase subunit [Promethearchaeota archaeon]